MRLSIFAAGFFAGIAVFFKQIAVFDCLALLIFTVYLSKARGDNNKNIATNLATIILGVTSANILSVIPVQISGGSLNDYWNAAWIGLFRGDEMSITPAERFRNFLSAWGHSFLIIPYLGIIGFVLNIKRLRQTNVPAAALLSWLVLDFIGVNAAGTYYGHQFRQLLPPTCVIFGIFFGFWSAGAGEKIALGVIIVTLICYIPAERNYRKGIQSLIEGYDNPGRELGLYIKNIREDNRYIYIWEPKHDQILIRILIISRAVIGRVCCPEKFLWNFQDYVPGILWIPRGAHHF